jgi:hypothetical protein
LAGVLAAPICRFINLRRTRRFPSLSGDVNSNGNNLNPTFVANININININKNFRQP